MEVVDFGEDLVDDLTLSTIDDPGSNGLIGGLMSRCNNCAMLSKAFSVVLVELQVFSVIDALYLMLFYVCCLQEKLEELELFLE